MGNEQCRCLDSGQSPTKFESYGTDAGMRMGASLRPSSPTCLVFEEGQAGELVEREPVVLTGGVRYTGQWRGAVREGAGLLERPDGGSYQGQFFANKAHGHGTLMHVCGDTYKGEWVEDRAQGWGHFTHQDGSSYEGQWHQDLQEGQGVEHWVDGSVYEGTWAAGKKHGKGKFIWSQFGGAMKNVYVGEFQNNLIHGEGEYHWFDGRSYKGEWHCNRIHGQGRMEWPDGRVYGGSYQDERKHGVGSHSWPDGRQYSGQWLEGKQHGLGTYREADGKVRIGEWHRGERTRWIDAEEDPEPTEPDAASGAVDSTRATLSSVAAGGVSGGAFQRVGAADARVFRELAGGVGYAGADTGHDGKMPTESQVRTAGGDVVPGELEGLPEVDEEGESTESGGSLSGLRPP